MKNKILKRNNRTIMKFKNIFWLVIISFVFFSCEQPQTPQEDHSGETISPGNDPEPYMSFLLVKFTDDKYRDYILAENIGSVRMRGRVPTLAEELIVGTIPYSVKLPNGYWAVDWRWGNAFIYRPSNVLLHEKWETLTHWNQTWELPENIIPFDDYIADCGCVCRRTIDNHLSINLDVKRWSDLDFMLYELPWVWWQYNSVADIPANEKEVYMSEVLRQDSLHAVYIQRLTQIIESGDFQKVYNK